MAAELRQDPASVFVVDLECSIEEDWGDDVAGAGVRVDEHNELTHPAVAAGAPGPAD